MAPVKFDVFLSYNSRDAALALELEHALLTLNTSAQPFTLFRYERSIAVTEEIKNSVTTAIANSSALLVPVTQNSATSNWVHFEIGYAAGCGTDIVPFLPAGRLPNGGGAEEVLPAYLDSKVYPTTLAQVLDHFGSTAWRTTSDYRKSLKNPRNRSTPEFCRDVGLSDIDHRDNTRNALPPAMVYNEAKEEIVIIGVSLNRVLDQHYSYLTERAQQGIRVRLMLLDPASQDVRRVITDWGHARVKREIRSSIKQIRELGLTKSDLIKIRYLPALPPFTGIMIDGDIEAKGPLYRDACGFVRIQPSARYVSQHNAPILQFHKKPSSSGASIFDMYATDIRRLWVEFARPKPRWSLTS